MAILAVYIPIILFIGLAWYLSFYTFCSSCKRRIYRVSDKIYRRVTKYILITFRCEMCTNDQYVDLKSKFAKNMHFKLMVKQLPKYKKRELKLTQKTSYTFNSANNFKAYNEFDEKTKEVKQYIFIDKRVDCISDKVNGLYFITNKDTKKRYYFTSTNIRDDYNKFLNIKLNLDGFRANIGKNKYNFDLLFYCKKDDLDLIEKRIEH